MTRPLVDAGASLLAVELGGRLAARLRTNLTGHDLTVIEGGFATAVPQGYGPGRSAGAAAGH